MAKKAKALGGRPVGSSRAKELEAVPEGGLPEKRSLQLLRWRLALGLSQARAGRVLGVGRWTLNRWETGRKPIPLARWPDARAAMLARAEKGPVRRRKSTRPARAPALVLHDAGDLVARIIETWPWMKIPQKKRGQGDRKWHFGEVAEDLGIDKATLHRLVSQKKAGLPVRVRGRTLDALREWVRYGDRLPEGRPYRVRTGTTENPKPEPWWQYQ